MTEFKKLIHTLGAANINQQICSNQNVNIPNTGGCGSSASSAASNAASQTVSSITHVVSGFSVAVSATSVASFTGEPLLTGSCTTPQFAVVTLEAGGFLEYAWQGCSNQDPDCCPFNATEGGQLSVCPKNYVTTSGACCPS